MFNDKRLTDSLAPIGIMSDPTMSSHGNNEVSCTSNEIDVHITAPSNSIDDISDHVMLECSVSELGTFDETVTSHDQQQHQSVKASLSKSKASDNDKEEYCIHSPTSRLIESDTRGSTCELKTQGFDKEEVEESSRVVLIGMKNVSTHNNTLEHRQRKSRGDDSLFSDSIYTSSERNFKSDDDSKHQRSIVLSNDEYDDLEQGKQGLQKIVNNTSFEEELMISDDDNYDDKMSIRKRGSNVAAKSTGDDNYVDSTTNHDSTGMLAPNNYQGENYIDDELLEVQQYFQNSMFISNGVSLALLNSDYESSCADNDDEACVKRLNSFSDNHNASSHSRIGISRPIHIISSSSDDADDQDQSIQDKKLYDDCRNSQKRVDQVVSIFTSLSSATATVIRKSNIAVSSSSNVIQDDQKLARTVTPNNESQANNSISIQPPLMESYVAERTDHDSKMTTACIRRFRLCVRKNSFPLIISLVTLIILIFILLHVL